MKKIICSLIFLTSIISYGEETIKVETNALSQAMNVRSSIQFYGQKNIIGQLPAGTQFDILSRKKLPSGAEALEIEVLSPSSHTGLNKKKPLYIWHSKKVETVKTASTTEADTACTTDDCKSQRNSSFRDIQDMVQASEEVSAFVQKTALTKEVTSLSDFAPSSEPQSVEQIESDTIAPPTVSKPASEKKFSQMTKAEKAAAIERYAKSPNVQNVINFNLKLYAGKKSGAHCYFGVKESLALEDRVYKSKKLLSKEKKPNLIPSWYGSARPGSAHQATKELPSYGFINLLTDPDYKDIMKDKKNWPKGAVLVYKGGRTPHGHTEIKLDDKPTGGQFGSDYVTSRPAIDKGKSYTLIGVMIRPDL